MDELLDSYVAPIIRGEALRIERLLEDHLEQTVDKKLRCKHCGDIGTARPLTQARELDGKRYAIVYVRCTTCKFDEPITSTWLYL